MWWSQRVHKWRHNMAHTRCMLDKQVYMHAGPIARAPTRTHARTYSIAHTYTIQKVCITYWFSTATIIREGASVSHYTYIACLFITQYTYEIYQNQIQGQLYRLSAFLLAKTCKWRKETGCDITCCRPGGWVGFWVWLGTRSSSRVLM